MFLSTLICAILAGTVGAAQPEEISFNRDIRPILSDLCFQCHGPDAAERVTDLRLDTEEGLYGEADDQPVLVPGDASSSELWKRISSDDPDYHMPPEDSGRVLTDEQRELLRRWIDEGAVWQTHWALISPARPEVPDEPEGPEFLPFSSAQAVDRFLLERLNQVGLVPSPRADRATLLRRVTLDLTGLPPTLDELDAFLADDSPDAYGRVVDRLLSSPAYGERMAIPWLDAARYADTSGYQSDGPRDMWRWRDWVIRALNTNMPFDQFTLEQLAGDLLPQPTLDQRIATGFHRNHRGNSEGGIIPEEYQVEYVVDRVATTGMVWLGLTLECARCHDHKYDPISQSEFYQLYAFFNNVPEDGRAIKEGNSPPYILAPTPEQQEALAELDGQLAELQQKVVELEPRLMDEQTEWERKRNGPVEVNWKYDDGLVAQFPLDGSSTTNEPEVDQAGAGADPSETLPTFVSESTGNVSESAGKSAWFDGSGAWEAGDVGRFGYFDKFSCGAWVRPSDDTGTIISRMTPEDQGDGYYLHLEKGRLQVNLIKRWLDDAIRVETRDELPLDQWNHVLFTYDGSRAASGIQVYINGKRADLEVRLDAINQSFDVAQPLRVGGGHRDYSGGIRDVRVYGRALSPREATVVAHDDRLAEILQRDSAARSAEEAGAVRAYYLDQQASDELRELHQHWILAERSRIDFVESLPTVMVMEEMETPRETFVLARGEYDKPTTRVEPGVPACLPPLPRSSEAPSSAADRLTLARWLIHEDHPLTARVIVNRQWELFFGMGLVKTAEDFGVQGEPPSHPALLDWLARELIDSGWDMKRLHRLIVTSAAYQQDSAVDAGQLERDPENRYLARGPRFRLPAEMLRDQALALAGLLVPRVGGPSVKPYQPEGLWQEIATVMDYDQSTGADLYLRGLYSYWKRTVAPPTMTNFDATARETCTVQRTRTNTPLQALNLLNDVTFVESARQLAARVLREGGESSTERLRRAFRLVTLREPSVEEERILREGLARHRDHFQTHPESATALLAVGDSPVPGNLDATELAAYLVVMNLLLNLDEVITRN